MLMYIYIQTVKLFSSDGKQNKIPLKPWLEVIVMSSI